MKNKELSTEKIRVTKKFTFDMAHALYGHDGPCRNIHGHTYHLTVTLIGKVLSVKNHPKNGMVIDFSELKAIVNKHVTAIYDHALVLNKDSLKEKLPDLSSYKIIYTDYQPTCENILIAIKNNLINDLPATVKLYSLRLDETPTSYAEWCSADNV